MTRGAVLVHVDSLRRDHVGCYGSAAETPNLDGFAERAAVFDRSYAASYPTNPNRHDLWTGRYNFCYRGWTSLAPDDVTLPGLLSEAGVTTQLVYDTPPMRGHGFADDFDGWAEERGHLGARVVTPPAAGEVELPASPHKLKHVGRTRQYLRNRTAWRRERDYVTPRTFRRAVEWLEDNRRAERFFLTVDTWGPHEQFDPPDHYTERYDDLREDVEDVVYAMYGHAEYMTDRERERVRARYAGEVSMADAWTGRLLDALEEFGLADDTLVIFTSDHGHLFGEHGLQGKPTGLLGRLYEESIRTPLLVAHPDHDAPDRVGCLTQPPDLTATLLEYFGVPVPDSVQGESLEPVLAGRGTTDREYAFTGRFPEGGPTNYADAGTEARQFDGWAGPANVSQPTTVTGERWALVCHPDPERSELYDLEADPDQTRDVADAHPERVAEMRAAYLQFLRERGAREEMVAPVESEGESYERESLAPDASLFTFTAEGHTFAYPSEANAVERAPDGDAVTETTFGALVEDTPRALLCLNQQYYWAAELSP